MSLFSRRRIQSMLNDLSATVDPKGFVGRLNDKRFEISIPAQAELAVVWCVDRLGGFQSEPSDFSPTGKRPEGISTNIFPGYHTVFDVKAVSDHTIPGVTSMRRAAAQFDEAANKIKKGSGRNLSFFFDEVRDYQLTKRHRTIKISEKYKINNHAIELLSDFVKSNPKKGMFIDIIDENISVRIAWEPGIHPASRCRSSTIHEIYDADDNYLVTSLKNKSSQLKSPDFEGLRGVFLFDIGSSALRRIGEAGHPGFSHSAESIILRFLERRNSNIDFVLILSPRIRLSMIGASQRYWYVLLIQRPSLNLPSENLVQALQNLPAPQSDSYSLWQLNEQRAFSPQSRGRHLGTKIGGDMGDTLTASISARAFQELIAGRMSPESFERNFLDLKFAFEQQLRRGNTIRSIQLRPGGIDRDDDYIEFCFGPDAAARDFSQATSTDEDK